MSNLLFLSLMHVKKKKKSFCILILIKINSSLILKIALTFFFPPISYSRWCKCSGISNCHFTTTSGYGHRKCNCQPTTIIRRSSTKERITLVKKQVSNSNVGILASICFVHFFMGPPNIFLNINVWSILKG